jgi:hypothetical protein
MDTEFFKHNQIKEIRTNVPSTVGTSKKKKA